MKTLISIVGMMSLLAAAFYFDGVYRQSQALAFSAFDFLAIASLLWLKLAFLLVFAAAILALAWGVLMRTERSILVSSVYVLAGLIVDASTTIPGSTIMLSYLRDTALYDIVHWSTISTIALAANAGAFIAVIGLAGLFLRAVPRILPAPVVARLIHHHAIG